MGFLMKNREILAVSLVLALALPMAACKHGRVLTGPPVTGNGAKVELVSARNKGNIVDITVTIRNDLNQELLVNRNQIAIVGTDGRDYYRTGGRELTKIPAHGKDKVSIASNGAGLTNVPGVYLRFDGIWTGGNRVDVPPMAIGQPKGNPGNVNASFSAPTSAPATIAETARNIVNPATPAAPGQASVQQYQGPHKKLKTPNIKCAAIPMKVKSKDVPDEVAVVMDEVFLTELQNSGFEAIGPDDINSMIGFEKVKEAVGCDDATCVAELGNALGVDYLAAGTVAKLEGSMVLTLKLFDVRQTKVLARANRIADGGPSTLPRLIGEAVQELVDKSGL